MATAKETMSALSSQKTQSVGKGNGKSLKDWITMMEPQIKRALPSVITPERFTRIALTAVSSNAKLSECTPTSFVGALMNAAQLGLEPNTPLGQAYLIPFMNNRKGCMEAQFQIGYKGLIDLAHRSGEFQTIYAEAVHENDEFDYALGDDPHITHKPVLKNRGQVIAYYAVYKLVNGGQGLVVMSKEDIEQHARKYSKSYNSGPWKSDFDAMAKKIVIKQLLKYAPIKTEFARNLSTDEAVTNASKSDDPTEGITLEQEQDYSYVEADAEVIDEEPEKEAE